MSIKENRSPVKSAEVLRIGGLEASGSDLLAVEEPLEIRLEFGPFAERVQRSIAVTMRTPGQDLELASGFLFGEGIIRSAAEIRKVDFCANVSKPEEFGNVVKVELEPGIKPNLEKLERHFYMSSSCGVCGKSSISALETTGCEVLPISDLRLTTAEINSLPGKTAQMQTVFNRTGGLHSASLFDRGGKLLLIREDVGRHNAVDKVVGRMVLDGGLPLAETVMLLSGRAGFELVQKAVFAKIPVLAAVGAPSSLAVELAKGFRLTLIGFLRDGRFNVYSVPERLDLR